MFSIGAPSRLVFTSGSLNHNLAHYNLTWTTDSFSPITAYKLRFKLSKVSADIMIYSIFHKNLFKNLKPIFFTSLTENLLKLIILVPANKRYRVKQQITY